MYTAINFFKKLISILANAISALTAKYIGAGLRLNHSITHLDLAGCCYEKFLELLTDTHTGNSLGHGGALAISMALLENVNIRFLGLEGNNIEEMGAAALADSLEKNTTLEILNVNCNIQKFLK